MRHRLNLSQTQFAEQIGVVLRTYSSWETGATLPTADSLALLAQGYGCTADYLLGLSDFETTLPPGAWVVDQDMLDAYRRGDNPDPSGRKPYAVAIPQRPRLCSSADYAAISEEVRGLPSPRKRRRSD